MKETHTDPALYCDKYISLIGNYARFLGHGIPIKDHHPVNKLMCDR